MTGHVMDGTAAIPRHIQTVSPAAHPDSCQFTIIFSKFGCLLSQFTPYIYYQ